MASAKSLKALVAEYGTDAAAAVKPVKPKAEYRDVQVCQVRVYNKRLDVDFTIFPKPVPKGQAARMQAVLTLMNRFAQTAFGKPLFDDITLSVETKRIPNKGVKSA